MISVLTLTYGRKQLLEESIHSFLLQDFDKSEMVIINDEPNVIYRFNHPKVKIINLNQRFENISKKIEWGFKECSYDYVYRLYDDDLFEMGQALIELAKQKGLFDNVKIMPDNDDTEN